MGEAPASVTLAGQERRLAAYLRLLWGLPGPLRALPPGEAPRRARYEAAVLRLPERWPSAALYRAAVTHAGAHQRFSRPMPVGSLKPLQVALVSLLEDARVERLALRELPGLRHLWLPFHQAAPGGPVTAAGLLARLSRALLDPDYADPDPWVCKGRALFAAAEPSDQAASRRIGGLLGNDLGQMRLQFDARSYVVEPPYRDDNRGLWEFEPAVDPGAEAEALQEGRRLERREGDGPPDAEQSPDERTGRARALAAEAAEGRAVARYPEWDYLIARERPDWVQVLACPVPPGAEQAIPDILHRHAATVERLAALIRQARVSRPARLRRQAEGDRLDLDACLEAAISLRAGEPPDPRVHALLRQRHRDLATLLLLDVSQSTLDPVCPGGPSVLALAREAAALLAEAMTGLGDPFALQAFCSKGREELRCYAVKGFDEAYDRAAQRRLAGLGAGFSTRLGAALRHAGSDLLPQRTHRRLLLVVTDGEPSDIDVGDRRYLVEDARRAVLTLAHRGIDVFCVGLGTAGAETLPRIFGRHRYILLDRVERLPERLPLLYLRLTA